MDGFSGDFTFDLGGFGGPEADPAVNGVLDRNLRAIARRCPETAQRISVATPHPGAEWVEGDEDRPGLVLKESGGITADPFGLGGAETVSTRVLASRRRPVTEARRLTESIDVVESGGVCVVGFAAGYHCEALAERLGQVGVVVCFEPDLSLLRAVLERVDHSEWIEKTNFVLLTDPSDQAAIARGIAGVEGILAVGIKILAHPASGPRIGGAADGFLSTFTNAVKSMRTTLTTTLVRSQASLTNMIMNADHYAASDGIEDLAGAAYGRPAIVVSAGPSLERNIAQLEDPRVREHAVIIAVQTMLKPLLQRGIRPHFVCALDYHELSKRFYEGLTEADVEGVTLVVEPKANPAILEAFPGRIRCVQEPLLDQLLGAELAGTKWPLKAGATVAHLCAYLGRHLGCDPLILVGQDLGFTDGQYYAAGASIHDVWAGELSDLRTLEMFEWERIARSRPLLRRLEDVYGRPIYSDEQMSTYLSQFELDFQADTARGLRVIDATEGGVRKQHTTPMPLAEALELYANGERVSLDEGGGARSRGDVEEAVSSRLETIAEQADKVGDCSRRAATLLGRMVEAGSGTAETNRLIDEVYGVRDEVRTLEPAYGLVQFVNQIGALRRYKADRSIEIRGLDDDERQTAQIERDASNVEWTADAAAELAAVLREASRVFLGDGSRVTTDTAPLTSGDETTPRRVIGLVMYDEQFNGLGLARSPERGEPALRRTVRRVLAAGVHGSGAQGSGALDEVVVATGSPEAVRTLLGELVSDPRVVIEHVDAERLRERSRAVGRARLIAPETWRSGLGGLSCYDESFEPRLALDVVDARDADAAVLVGPDWELVDADLLGRAVTRYREWPESVKIVISQAPPGLGGLLLDRGSLESIASGVPHASSYASVGGLLAYLPAMPQADPIAKAFCVQIPAPVRDAGRRFVADTPEGAAMVERVRTALGDTVHADAEKVVAAAGPATACRRTESPRHLELELCTGRLLSGRFGQWLRASRGAVEDHGSEAVERPVMPTEHAARLVESLAAGGPDTVLTLHGVGDPLMHPGVFDVIRAAKVAGVGLVHLRTDGLSEAFDAERILGSGVDVVSVDMLAASAETYRVMTGVDRYEGVKSGVESLLAGRGERAGLPGVWVVPRITRCDETYEDIEAFYDGWLMACCAAVIDPAPGAGEAGARIGPLPVPALARSRRLRETLVVRSDGRAFAADGSPAGDVLAESLEAAWRAIWRGGARVAA